MSLSQKLWNANQDAAREALEMPFIQGIGDGTLSRACYNVHIQQNSHLIEAIARVYSIAAGKVPDWESFGLLHELAGHHINDRQLNAKYLPQLTGSNQPGHAYPTTRHYINLLIATVLGHDVGLTMAAMASWLRVPNFIASELTRNGMPDHQYAVWLKVAEHPIIGELLQKHDSVLDRYATDTSLTHEIYRYSIHCFQATYQTAWEAGQDK